MGMEFSQHIPHGARRFLMLGTGRQPKLRHRINNAPLDRFQAVPDVGQRPVQNDVHGIVEVGALAELVQRPALDIVEVEL